MAHPNPWLVLFDIDGTLIQSGRAGLRGMNRAFERLYGRPGALTGVPIAGRTDRAIVIDAMRAVGQDPTNAEIVRLRDAYLEDLRSEIGRPVSDPSGILPGVVDMLDDMTARPDVIVALLTGNFHGGAAIKLGHFGLWERFRFGAFGDEHVDRRALVPLAVRVALEAGCGTPPPERVVIIGDTPLDVDCARAYGARCLAVATGTYSAASLAEAGADLVVPTLEHVGDVLSRL
jgi:phosphoglycolate phosphatase-like HAD superfamily hydrolase